VNFVFKQEASGEETTFKDRNSEGTRKRFVGFEFVLFSDVKTLACEALADSDAPWDS
jgi:hypothetical protein